MNLTILGYIMKHFQNLILALVVLLLSACGGGGSSGTSVEQEPLKTLYFIDAPVNGIDYTCGNRKAKTQSVEIDGTEQHGVAMCRKGSVTFSIGDFTIGTVESYHDHQKIYLADFVDVSTGLVGNEALIKLGMLIQSLDDDGNIETKIDIDGSVNVKITSLDSYTVASLQTHIQSLNKTPKTQEEVIEHIIKFIDPKYGKEPTVNSSQLTLSSSEMVGNTIGTVDIESGDAALLSVTLSGEGSEYFEIINNQEIRLKQQLRSNSSYELNLTAMNTFGESSGTITIDVVNTDKVAKIALGALANATVKIYSVDKKLIATTTSNATGDFDLMLGSLDEQSAYIYEITQGETTHSDVDGDGIQDEYATANEGVVRLILKKEWIESAAKPIYASTLSEMHYLYAVESLNSQELDKKLDEVAKVLLQDDLNGDGKITAEDTILFNPSIHQSALMPSIATHYDAITNQILLNDTERFKAIFDTKVIKKFDDNATGCSPYTLCAFELQPSKIKYRNSIAYSLKDNRLYIYDTVQEKTLSFVDLPSSEYGIYLDHNTIFLSAANQDIITLDLSILDEPKIADVTFPTQGYILGQKESQLLIYQGKELIIVDRDSMSEIKRYTMPPFDQVIVNRAYSFMIANNQLSINHYTIENPANISTTATYTLNGIANDAKVMMDEEQNIYTLTPNQSLGIYRISNGKVESIGSLNLNATDIINITDNTLYAYGNRQIYQIDISYLDTPRISNTFDFEQTTNALYFDENILYTPHYIIDLNALMLSSPYITLDTQRALNQEYDIELEMIRDRSLFEPF
jgi:hypothetical protein